MRGMNSGCIDLIYLDPPFNSNRNYAAPIGSKAAGAFFKDAWTLDDVDVHEHGELAELHPAAYAVIEAARQSHGKGMQSYLIMMAVRLLEMHRILKPTGSLYLHCDTTANGYLRLLLDAVFGKDNFRNEIIWCYSGGGVPRKDFPRKHDVIFRYSRGNDWTFHVERKPYKANTQQVGKHSTYSKHDTTIDLERGTPVTDWWTDINTVTGWSPEKVSYPTQKPEALLTRIIAASSNPGDLVLDPFCGCATTLVAADRLQRQWVGIDLSPLAIKLVGKRIKADNPLFSGATALTDPPQRTDLDNLPNYRTHKHRLYGAQEGVCNGCEMHFPFKIFEVDHILPRAKGGTDAPDNLQLLCSHCNRSKGGRTMAEWKADG